MINNPPHSINPSGISIPYAITTFFYAFIIIVLALAKIYLANKIYYESKIVNKIDREVSILKSQRVILLQKIEALKFKNRVADTIFRIEENEENE